MRKILFVLAWASTLGAALSLSFLDEASAAIDCSMCVAPATPVSSAEMLGSSNGHNIASLLALESNFWDGKSELPNAFHAPWSFQPSDLDPSFTTSYWSEEKGFVFDSPDAPWNQGMAQAFSDSIIRWGKIYLGDSTPDHQSATPFKRLAIQKTPAPETSRVKKSKWQLVKPAALLTGRVGNFY